MVVTNWAKTQLLYALGSNIPNNFINSFALGISGTGVGSIFTISSGATTLNGSEFIRNGITGSPTFTLANNTVTFQGDFNSVQVSGLILTQFGNFATTSINTGSAWMITSLAGSLVCDGTIELQFTSTYSVN